MKLRAGNQNLKELVDKLNFKEKVERSLALLEQGYNEFGDRLVVANSLGKDSAVVWDLAQQVNHKIRGFIVTTKFKPSETKHYMMDSVAKYPTLSIYRSNEDVDDNLYNVDPDKCCYVLKVEPTRKALSEMNAGCWVTGLRCTEGLTRTDFQEIEERDPGLIKLNPILVWKEREIWQYLALYGVNVNPLYREGYRSLGCLPCTRITGDDNERAGRWIGTSKCGGECGIHTKPLK